MENALPRVKNGLLARSAYGRPTTEVQTATQEATRRRKVPSLPAPSDALITPLPFTPFEHFMLADDTPDHPMTFFVRLQFRGIFNRPHFQTALSLALEQHPLLNSLIRGSAADRTSDIAWVTCLDPMPAVDWADADTPLTFSRRRWIDLRSERGIRLWIRDSKADETTQLILQIHHSCCDGIGANTFISTLLTAYHKLDSGTHSAAIERSFQPELLRMRDQSCSSWAQLARTAWRAIFRTPRFFKGKPIPLAACRKATRENMHDEKLPEFETFTFSREETESLRLAAKEREVSVNDLLSRDLFLALDDWNRTHSPNHESRPIRICMPVNLRRSGDRYMPAANRISLSFLDRGPEHFAAPDTLLKSLQKQTEETKKSRKILAFVPALKLIGMLPGRMSARMNQGRCLATAAISNLGVLNSPSQEKGRSGPTVAGNMTLESIEALLPLHPQTHVAFVILSYCDRLSITLSRDPRWIDEDEGRELLTNYVRVHRSSIAGQKQ